MKSQEIDKVNALLDYMGFTEESSQKILSCIMNSRDGEDELIELVERIKNWEE